ncbi:MAG: ATP-binding protein [Acidobacteriota bacterium]|nr:ATP-binding protein [Acidobacteriota bacterium]
MKRDQILKITFCLLLALAAVALAGVSVRRKIASFQPLGFEPAAAGATAGGLVRVARVSDPRTGLLAHDQILLVNGHEIREGAAELAAQLRRQPASDLALLRGEQFLRLRYQRPPLVIDYPYLILALIGVLYLLIGFYTLLRQSRHEGTLFFLWCLASAALYLLTAVPPADVEYKLVFLGDELARIFLPPLTLHLFLIFPRALFPVPPLRRTLPFLYLPAALLGALQLDLGLANGRFLFGVPTDARILSLDHLELLHLVAFALAALAAMAARLLRGEGWEQRRQLQWMVFGLAGGYLPFLLLYTLPTLLGLRPAELLASVAVLPLGLVPLCFAYAILRYKLWDIEVIARDVAASTLTLLLGLIGFSLVNLMINRGVPTELALARNLLSFAAGLGIAGLLVPTRRTLASTLERLHYRGTFGKRRALSGLGRELLLERDLGRLCSALLERLRAGVDLEDVNLYLAQGTSLLAAHSAPGAPSRFALNAFGDDLWREGFLRLSGVELPAESPGALQRLFIAGYRYAFPLSVRGRGVGFVVTGFKRDRMPLNSEDLELIRHLLNQAALAIENAQLLGQLQDQLAEVQRLQSYSEGIFESSPAGIAVLDGTGRLVSANLAFSDLVGLSRQALIGRSLAEILPVSPLVSAGSGPVEVSFRGPAGGERHLQMSLAEFARGGIEPLHILVVLDVSDRVAMESALKEKERLAALGMLAAGVAHEVNTPITGISSYAQMLLAETSESDPHYAILKKVERQTFRAARIVNNLLELARNRQRERHPVAISPLLGECLELLGERLDRKRIEVRWSPPAREAETIQVLGSDGELQQVFTNLLLNGLDAMSAQASGVISVDLTADDAWVQVAVRDTGPGIPPDRLDAVFQPFFSTKLQRGGTGLGLSISHDIVERHGGSVKVASTPGLGACFVVELPRHHAASAISA